MNATHNIITFVKNFLSDFLFLLYHESSIKVNKKPYKNIRFLFL